MPSFPQRVPLGRTGLQVSKLGLGASFKAPTSSYLEAFDRGVNYFYWGSIRRREMGDAIREIATGGRRDQLVCVLQSYSRVGPLLTLFVERGLRSLGLERADAILLGWHNKPPSRGVLDAALRLKERGLIDHVALSTHHRRLLPTLLDEDPFDVWHLRYNAVHRGAEQEVFPSLEGRDVSNRPGIATYTATRWGDLCNPAKTPPNEPTPSGTDCYRFALSRPEVDLCIAGPDNPDHMEQALTALELGPMEAEELSWMSRVGKHIYAASRASGVMDGR